MLETIKYATISNIYVKKLIFFNPEKEESLRIFCNFNGITYLPGKDRKTCYHLTNNKFLKTKITEELICYPHDRIFDEATLSKFEKGNQDEVMFVIEDDIIKGVVHIVDYNNDFINYEFFKATYLFEKMLRVLLIQQGENDDSLLQWMKIKSAKSNHWDLRYKQCMPDVDYKLKEQIAKRKDCSPFQTFFLNDLLFFVASRKYISLHFRRSIESIKSVRNWVAHNKDLAHKSYDNNYPLYRIKELKEFVKNSNDFFKCYEELEYLLISEKSP